MSQDWQTLTKLTAGQPIRIERVRLADAGVAIEGQFDLPPLAQLSAEDQIFVAAFVRCHGSIKQMNIRVPIALVKSGMRLGSVIPGLASDEIMRRLRERGIAIDLASLDQAQIDELVKNLGELNFDIDSGHAKVRITCE